MKKYIICGLLALTALGAAAQESSSSAVMTRGSRTRPGQAAQQSGPTVSARLQQQLDDAPDPNRPDASVKFMRVIYRDLDLANEDKNAPLYFPEDLVDGQENLFRIMFRLLAQNKVPAYQFLDGREEFTEERRVKMADIISKFSILAKPAKGSSEKNPIWEIDPIDVPTHEVLKYYIIERWVFDNRSNSMKTIVEAICPVIVEDESSYMAGTTPMFWMKMSDLKPYLRQQYIFTDDDNNLAQHTYDDFFTMNMYKGDIYKTRNLRNRTLKQMFDGEDEVKQASDSIQNRLEHYADNLWVPTREELRARRQAADSLTVETPVKEKRTSTRATRAERASRSDKASTRTKVKREKTPKQPSSPSSSATRSVRNRRK